MSTRKDQGDEIDVYIEMVSKRVFACALEWPGWCRSGKDEGQALAALAAAAPRYAPVAREAGLSLPATDNTSFRVVERLSGTTTTDFGAPDQAATRDGETLTDAEAERLASLLAAAWDVFDRIVASAPAELRKGPRGGGRDRDAVVKHVLGAETMYARKLGIRQREPAIDDTAAIADLRTAIADRLRSSTGRSPVEERGWLPRYAARRLAWHVLDHAWEIEDKSS
jgi:hypothetical protein